MRPGERSGIGAARSRPGSSGPRVLVIGAGVVGVATAYALARRGAEVVLVDGEAEVGRGSSYANGGQLSFVYTDALASPAILRQLPALVLGGDEAFSLRLRADPSFLRWGLSFLRNCTAQGFERNTLQGLRLGFESRLALHDLLERHPLEFGHVLAGKLHLHEHAATFAAARRLVELKRAHGAVQEVLSAREAIALEPALEGRRDSTAGAIYSPEEEAGDPYRFCRALAAVLSAEYQVEFRLGTRVARIETARRPAAVMGDGDRIEADTIVLCAGPGTSALLKGTGVPAPILPVKGYSFTAGPGAAPPRISITDVARRLVFCRLGDEMRVAGIAQIGIADTVVDERILGRLVASARASLGEAADYDRISWGWSGLRPLTPNSLPVISRPSPGLVLNVGHGMLGWTYAMGSAERAAALAVEGSAHG